jgi:hypothetical protein
MKRTRIDMMQITARSGNASKPAAAFVIMAASHTPKITKTDAVSALHYTVVSTSPRNKGAYS